MTKESRSTPRAFRNQGRGDASDTRERCIWEKLSNFPQLGNIRTSLVLHTPFSPRWGGCPSQRAAHAVERATALLQLVRPPSPPPLPPPPSPPPSPPTGGMIVPARLAPSCRCRARGEERLLAAQEAASSLPAARRAWLKKFFLLLVSRLRSELRYIFDRFKSQTWLVELSSLNLPFLHASARAPSARRDFGCENENRTYRSREPYSSARAPSSGHKSAGRAAVS